MPLSPPPRVVLDFVKQSKKIEGQYFDAAITAAEFFTKNNRRQGACGILQGHSFACGPPRDVLPLPPSSADLHRFCELIRRHFGEKPDGTTDTVDLDRFHPLLKLRLVLLQSCTKLDLWSDALLASEDFFVMIESAKTKDAKSREAVKQISPAFMVQFYDDLATTFLSTKNLLFHAFALCVTLLSPIPPRRRAPFSRCSVPLLTPSPHRARTLQVQVLRCGVPEPSLVRQRPHITGVHGCSCRAECAVRRCPSCFVCTVAGG